MKVGRGLGAVLAIAAGVWVVLPATTASAVPIFPACAGTTVGTTFTLTADCDTTVPLEVPDGFTVDGAGHTITAHDVSATVSFIGAVVTNAGASMHLRNLTVRGTGFPNVTCDLLAGIQFADADGSVSNVTVLDITRNNSCVSGNGLRVNSVAPRTVTITNTTLAGFQRSGLFANGPSTVHVSGSTIGPPDDLAPGVNAQNAVQIGSGNAGGTFTGNTVVGRGFGGTGASSTAMLLFTASNLTVSNNTITGAGTDIGIAVDGGSTNITIENNVIERTAPDSPDPSGFGVSVLDAASTGAATLVCNTFSGWVAALNNVTQAPCITTTTLPDGTVGSPYSAALAGTTPNPPLTWSAPGLPPGLTLAPDGSISGTPTAPGTFTITVTATDSTGATATRDLTITIAQAPPVAPLVWEPLGGIVVDSPAAATPGPGRLDVVVRGADSQLWHEWFEAGRWSGWEPLGGLTTSGPAMTSWSAGRLDVFVNGLDGQLWHKWFDGAWSGWVPLGGIVVDSPAAATPGPGRLDVVVRGADSQLWHRWHDGASWSGWVPLGGLTTSGPAATSWSAGRLDVFVNGLDGQLWHKWFDGAWSDWVPLGGIVVDSPAAATPGPGRLDVVVRGADNQTWHKWFDAGSWSGWEALGGLTTAGPATTSWLAGRLDVFVNGLDSQLWHRS